MKEKDKKLISSIPLSMLVVIVKSERADNFLDLLQSLDINLQLVEMGSGTTKSTVFNSEVGTKAIIIGIIREDNIKKAMELLQEKFTNIFYGKGVAFTVPLSSVMGVQFFNFLANNKKSLA